MFSYSNNLMKIETINGIKSPTNLSTKTAFVVMKRMFSFYNYVTRVICGRLRSDMQNKEFCC